MGSHFSQTAGLFSLASLSPTARTSILLWLAILGVSFAKYSHRFHVGSSGTPALRGTEQDSCWKASNNGPSELRDFQNKHVLATALNSPVACKCDQMTVATDVGSRTRVIIASVN